MKFNPKPGTLFVATDPAGGRWLYEVVYVLHAETKVKVIDMTAPTSAFGMSPEIFREVHGWHVHREDRDGVEEGFIRFGSKDEWPSFFEVRDKL